MYKIELSNASAANSNTFVESVCLVSRNSNHDLVHSLCHLRSRQICVDNLCELIFPFDILLHQFLWSDPAFREIQPLLFEEKFCHLESLHSDRANSIAAFGHCFSTGGEDSF